MAEIAVQRLDVGESAVKVFKWEGVTESDTCEKVALGPYNDVTIQVDGTMGGTSVALQGTLDPSASSEQFSSLTDSSGATIALTTDGDIKEVLQNVLKVKPVLTGGSSTSIDIYVMGR